MAHPWPPTRRCPRNLPGRVLARRDVHYGVVGAVDHEHGHVDRGEHVGAVDVPAEQRLADPRRNGQAGTQQCLRDLAGNRPVCHPLGQRPERGKSHVEVVRQRGGQRTRHRRSDAPSGTPLADLGDGTDEDDPRQPARAVDAQVVGDDQAPVGPAHHHRVATRRREHGGKVVRPGPRVVVAALGHVGVTVSPQVGGDQPEPLAKLGVGELRVPDPPRLGPAVDEHERGSVAIAVDPYSDPNT